MKRLRIYYVIDQYDGPSSGTEKQLLMLISSLARLGHDPRLFVLRHTPYTRQVSDFPCPIECLEVLSGRSIASLRRLLAFRARIRRDWPDVLHAFFNDAIALIPLLCRVPGVLLVTSRRDMGFWYTRAKLLLLRLANTRVDRVICNCNAVAREVAKHEGVAPEKLLVIYNGIADENQPVSRPGPGAGAATPDAGIGGDEPRICLVANLRPVKRIEDFIRAAALVASQYPDCQYWIVGEALDIRYEAELRRLVSERGLEARVRFFGAVNDPFDLIRHCTIGVLTSSSEGLSNSILEYMHASLPVVCSDVGGNGELVVHDSSGYLYPAGDVDALSRFLVRLIGDEALQARMGAASRTRISLFSPDDLVRSHLLAYGLDSPGTDRARG